MNFFILNILVVVVIALQTVIIYRLRNYQYEKLTERYELAFYKDANSVGGHGFINVSSKIHGLHNVTIPFGFKGVNNPPAMTLSLMKLIVDQAESQGYKVNFLVSYSSMNKETTHA